jgi:hypothetical protein
VSGQATPVQQAWVDAWGHVGSAVATGAWGQGRATHGGREGNAVGRGGHAVREEKGKNGERKGQSRLNPSPAPRSVAPS